MTERKAPFYAQYAIDNTSALAVIYANLLARERERAIAEHQARVDRGDECPECGARGPDEIERTNAIAPLFSCRLCHTSWFDLTGAP